MDKQEIIVTIGCLTYNHENFIRRALDGFIAQKTNFKYEIVVHDDASADNTINIIKEYKERYPDIIIPVIETENQYSKGTLRLRCFNPYIRGKYIAICEGDDYWTDPNKLQVQVDYLEAYPECSFAFHNAKIIGTNGRILKNSFLPGHFFKNSIWHNRDMVYETPDIIKFDFIPTASIVARTQFFKESIDFCDKPVCGDLPLKLYLACKGKAYYVNRKMSMYRTGNPSSASGLVRNSKDALLKTYNGHIDILQGFNKHTGYTWDKDIRLDMERRKVWYLMSTGNITAIKQAGLLGAMKNEITIYARLAYYMRTHLSSLYNLLKKIRDQRYTK